MENTVFKRNEANSSGNIISPHLYNLVIGLVLAWGFLVNWVMVRTIPPEMIYTIPPLILIIGYLGLCFLGVMIFTKSDSPVISFLGYNLVVFPFGLVVNLAVHQYDPELVVNAVRVTGLVTVVMMVLGSLFPAFFKKIAGLLAISLLVVIIIELVEVFIFGVHHAVLDWVVAMIFCGYIGYDWARANSIPKTLDNAVDSAASLYMDILILFLRILRIMGRRS